MFHITNAEHIQNILLPFALSHSRFYPVSPFSKIKPLDGDVDLNEVDTTEDYFIFLKVNVVNLIAGTGKPVPQET